MTRFLNGLSLRGWQLADLRSAAREFIPRTAAARDTLAIGLICAFVYLISQWLNLFEQVSTFVTYYEDWGLDELFNVAVALVLALVVFGHRRNRELKAEIKARGAAEAQALKLARHDPLTGLPNRRALSEHLDEALEQTLAQGARVAVLMLDLDGFKQVNDTHGHAVGDRALMAATDRIRGAMRDGSTLARFGGDEFAIVIAKLNSLDGPTKLSRRIVSAFAEPIVIGDITLTLGIGIGIAIAPDDGTGSDELMRRADRALYRAKAEGPSSVRFFEAEMDAHIEERMRLERELRAAIGSRSIVPYFQPIVSLDGNRIIGFEALARWKSPTSGNVPPGVFIPIAEEAGLIATLSDQLLRQACIAARNWPKDLTLSFNISPVQLRDKTLGLRILSILGQTGFDPHRLELEITESALVEDIGIAESVIDQLRGAGVHIALDDFGTGYATLSQLLALRLDKIKIDRSFVERLGKDNESAVVVRAIIGLANGFGLITTAEGIEEKDQLTYLK